MSYESGNPGRLFEDVHLQWFAETPLAGPPAGQPAPSEPPASAPVSGEPSPPASAPKVKEPAAPTPGKGKLAAAKKSFYEHVAPDGRIHKFETPDALTEHMNKSFMSQKDYSKKTEDLARQNARIRQRETEFEATAKSQKEMGEKYSGFKKFIESNPGYYEELQQRMQLPPSPDDAYSRVMSEVKEMFDGFKKELAPFTDHVEQQKFDDARNSVFEELKGEFPDLNKEELEDYMGNLAGDTVAFNRAMVYSMLHQQGLQQGSPEQQQRVAEAAAAAKRNGRMLPAGSPPPAARNFASNEEAKQQGLADAHAQGQL